MPLFKSLRPRRPAARVQYQRDNHQQLVFDETRSRHPTATANAVRCSPAMPRQYGKQFDRSFDISQSAPYGNKRKRYAKVKSRFMDNAITKCTVVAAQRNATKELLTSRKCTWLERERFRLAIFDDPRMLRAALLPPIEFAYLDMVEADGGRLDRAASAFGYLVKVDDERMEQLLRSATAITVPSLRKNPHLLAVAKDALTDGNPGWPLSLLRAAFVFVGDGRHAQWLWAAELLLLAAVSQASGADDGLDEATCLLAIGWFYGHAGAANCLRDTLPLSVRFLEEARRAADGHRSDWFLPADVRHAIERATVSGPIMNDIGDSVWAVACFFEHEVLMKAARKLDPNRALRTVQVAHRLATELGSVGLNRRHLAAVAYELGVRYAAVGAYDQAVKAFGECAASAAGLDSGLDLDALLEAARTYPGPPKDSVLERIAESSLDRGNVRVLVKAIVTRARLSADNGKSNEAFRQYLIAYRLAITDADEIDADTVDSTRLFAAINRTCTFWKFNFRSLSERAYDLLADPLMWTADRRSLIIRNRLDGCIYMNTDRFQDAIIENQTTMLRLRLGKLDADRDDDRETTQPEDYQSADVEHDGEN